MGSKIAARRAAKAARILRVQANHRRAGIELPNERIHAVLHAAVETHAAMGDAMPVRRTIRRLMEQDGLSPDFS